MRNEYIFITN